MDYSDVNQNITQNGNITAVESLPLHFNNERKIKTELTLSIDDISFCYGVQVGKGGLMMSNGSSIYRILSGSGTTTYPIDVRNNQMVQSFMLVVE